MAKKETTALETARAATVSQDAKTHTHGHKIVVIQAGWVITGKVEARSGHLRVTDGSVIRRWGTTMGLGQLAITGRTDETVLDPFGTAEVPNASVLFTIDCVAPI